jgi:hypothetical protein
MTFKTKYSAILQKNIWNSSGFEVGGQGELRLMIKTRGPNARAIFSLNETEVMIETKINQTFGYLSAQYLQTADWVLHRFSPKYRKCVVLQTYVNVFM